MSDYKRVTHNSVHDSTRDDTANVLSTIGMRIRKSVADGYNVSSDTHASKLSFGFNRRQPLPSHISEPPSLSSGGSTFESGSSFSSFGSSNHSSFNMHTPALQTIGNPVSQKRRLNNDDYSSHPEYGVLQLNEDF